MGVVAAVAAWPTLGPPAGDRTVLNGMVWKFRTCTAWQDVPERNGSWATLHTRFRGWARTARSTGCSRPPRQRPMRSATSTGLCRSTSASCAPTSTRPGPEKVAVAARRPAGPGAV
ncbi:transposase [Streptomyces sp. NPDC088246]|uniref:transposase n=1 Tax=Streptomyces sp. NPDC088246 TaxID=3365842 RepID=UPI0037F53200